MLKVKIREKVLGSAADGQCRLDHLKHRYFFLALVPVVLHIPGVVFPWSCCVTVYPVLSTVPPAVGTVYTLLSASVDPQTSAGTLPHLGTLADLSLSWKIEEYNDKGIRDFKTDNQLL